MSQFRNLMIANAGGGGTLNLIAVGSATVDSDFIYTKSSDDTSSYFYQNIDLSNFNDQNDTLEIVGKVKMDVNNTTGCLFLYNDNDTSRNLAICKYGSDVYGVAKSVVNTFTLNFSPIRENLEDWFFVKYTYDNSDGFKVYVSTDNINWSQIGEGSGTWSFWLSQINTIAFGKYKNPNNNVMYGFYGSIDFKEWYIKVNGNFIWKGVE